MIYKTHYDEINKIFQSAQFSEDMFYRYTLTRWWGDKEDIDWSKFVCWLMLNPSTADEKILDPTIRRCLQYSKNWGFSGLLVLNLFAFRATNPVHMKSFHDPVGPENNDYIRHNTKKCGLVVAGWGGHGSFQNRSEVVKGILKDIDIYCLGQNEDGSPKHPLYLKKDLKPILYQRGKSVS